MSLRSTNGVYGNDESVSIGWKRSFVDAPKESFRELRKHSRPTKCNILILMTI